MVIDSAFDKFHELVSNAISAHGASLSPAISFKELYDNVVIENNDEKLLKNGYCIQFSSDVNGERILCGQTEIKQTVYVTFTTANFGTIRDVDLRKSAEKRLFAVKDAVKKAIGLNPHLDDTVASCLYNGSDPIELIFDENEKVFLMIKSTYTIGYFE
jgi:hypothetical protein